MNEELTAKMVEQLIVELQEKNKLIDGMRREINMLHAHIQSLESEEQEDEDKPQYFSLNDPLKGKM